MIARYRELRALVDEVAVVDPRDPAWAIVLGGAALIEEVVGRAREVPYVSSDADPHGDTFLGWAAPAPRDLAEAIADAVLDAGAASRALAELDGTLPGQPLAVTARLAAADPRRARFAIAGRRRTVRIDAAPEEVARAVARGDGDDAPAPIAAVVGDHEVAIARHLHRRAWLGGDGPWLGVGRAGGLALASTCHVVVDGYGHALIAARIAAARDEARRRAVARAAAEIVGAAPVPAPPPLAGTEPLGIAWRRVPGLPRLAALAHALGVVLHEEAGDPAAPRSPTIQIPIARGERDDPARWRRRVVHALASVRFADGRAEPVDAFARRLAGAIGREVDGGGLLTRLIAATAALPVPMGIKRRRVAGARGGRWTDVVDVLAGRSSLSVMRVQPADAPRVPGLIAVSAPGVVLPPDAPWSTSVVTIVDEMVTVAGTGTAGTAEGAQALLDRWIAAF